MSTKCQSGTSEKVLANGCLKLHLHKSRQYGTRARNNSFIFPSILQVRFCYPQILNEIKISCEHAFKGILIFIFNFPFNYSFT